MDIQIYQKDPDDTGEYKIDWSPWLGSETIVSAAWTATGLTTVSQSISGGTTAITLSGGSSGTTYTVTCHVVTATRAKDESIRIRVQSTASPADTMAQLISDARGILGDRSTPYRYSDEDLLGYANDALAVLATVRPELFSTTVTHTCAQGAVQVVSMPSTVGINSIAGLRPSLRILVERIDPDWASATPGTPLHWMPFERDPRRFYVTPPATQGLELEVSVAYAPDRYTLEDSFPIVRTMRPPVVDYVVGMAEARNDESVLAQRAQQFMTKFANTIGAGGGNG